MKKTLISLAAFLLVLTLCFGALADNVLRPGDKGDKVKAVQRLLYQYGYYTGKIDGVYGKSTANAVVHFQEFNDLDVDGKVGPRTYAVLTSGGAVPATLDLDLPAEDQKAIKEATVEVIKQVQTALKSYGYYSGKITGTFNEGTVAAIRSFQKYNGLTVTGGLNDATMDKLMSDKVVLAPVANKQTASKDVVLIVQARLAHYGYYTLKQDGLYGAGTIAAVKAFQKANGLKVDGVVGKSTLDKLLSEDAVSKSVAADKKELDSYPVLRKGAKNASVKKAQQLLKTAGFYSGKVDGEYKGDTITAVKAFQKAKGLKADGKVGPATWAMLLGLDYETIYPNVPKEDVEKKDDGVLRYGDKGDKVKALQQKLRSLGYSLKADGVFGDKTITIVRKFQTANKLEPDGKVGPDTMAAIDSQLAKKAAEPKKEDNVLRYGDKGDKVKALQEKLIALGYKLTADGTYGSKTITAVRSLQKANKLTQDGKVGPDTMAVIDKLLAQKTEKAGK